jgi:deoxyribonuclease V
MIHHRWDITPKQAVAVQRDLADQVVIAPLIPTVRTVAGTDCAFTADGQEIVAAAVLCDAKTLAVIATAHVRQNCTFPYVPGLLSFREAPAVIAAVAALPGRPDLLLCDGQGLAHPRRFGLACHVGVWLDLPTIGVAKSRLIGDHRTPGRSRGCRARLVHQGQTIGAVVRTRDGVKPLYISIGHRVTLDDAVRWALRCARRYRLAEPNRQAHILVGKVTHTRAGGPISPPA